MNYIRDAIGRFAKKGTSANKLQPLPNGVKINKNGAMTIDAGVDLQRISSVANPGQLFGEVAYASVIERDNAAYVHFLRTKPDDKILSLRSVKTLSSPSTEEAVSIMTDLLKRDDFRDAVTIYHDQMKRYVGITDATYKHVVGDATGESAQYLYFKINQSMTIPTERYPDIARVQTIFRDELERRGYNMLLDENDVINKRYTAPLILMNPKDTVAVTSVNDITHKLLKESAVTVRRYEKLGKNWIDKNVYGVA